ncbi:MAG: cell division protein FtsL [Pseudomonadales bacterium]|nr:cell division protein FtsL [Pseudomonadales bacterium]
MPTKNNKRTVDRVSTQSFMPAVITIMLAFCVVGTALSVVYATHKNRLLSAQLQHLKTDQRTQQLEWGRLLLERSTWSSHERIWSLAHKQLNMHEPSPSEWVIVTNGN